MTAAVVELDFSLHDAGNKRRFLEDGRVAARRIDDAGSPERLPEIAGDVPPLGPLDGFLQLVNDVLLIFQVRIPEHRLDDQQAFHLAVASDRVTILRPRLFGIEPVKVWRLLAESGRELRIR